MSLVANAEFEFRALAREAKGLELAFREDAWREYQRLGLPDRRSETWKYSTLTGLLNRTWSQPKDAAPILARAVELRESWKSQFDVIIIQNGEVRLDQSCQLRQDLTLDPLALVSECGYDDGFLGMSAALSRPGLSLRVKGKAPRPVMLVHALSGDGVWSKSYHRVHVEAEGELDLVEMFVGEGAYLRSDLMRLELDRGAHVNWVRIQDEDLSASHFSDYRANLTETSALNLTQVHCGSAWTKTALTVDIRDREAVARMSGLIFAQSAQHIDQRVVANHWAGSSSSAQLFKGVLKDRTRATVNGRIFVAKDAQKVNSSHFNHNLLLNPGAEANSKPELEIYADDVKATHGASVGRMDEEKLFYLESRGIRRVEAMQILARAFVGDVLMKVTSKPLRTVLDETITSRLPDFARQMEGEK